VLWTYETVSEATGIASKYWDAEAPSERGTKTLAKEKLIATRGASRWVQAKTKRALLAVLQKSDALYRSNTRCEGRFKF